MTLLPASVILVARHDERARRDVFAYLAITHLGGIGRVGRACSCWPITARSAACAAARRRACARWSRSRRCVGFGTKAGAMPLHSWLPRAHPLAPGARVGADVGGDDQARAVRARARAVSVGGARPAVGRSRCCSRSARCPRSAACCTRCFSTSSSGCWRFTRSRTSGSSSWGSGRRWCSRRSVVPQWSAIAFAAALLHTLNHAVFKALLFLGAGSFSSAVGELELDRLGGLLRRMPWTGGRVRARGDGDRRAAAAERVRVGVDDASVAAACRRLRAVRRRRSRERSRRPRSRRPRRSRCSASSR